MSLDRTPSPIPSGGWSSKGLSDSGHDGGRSGGGGGSGASSGRNSPFVVAGMDNPDRQWAAARARSEAVRTGAVGGSGVGASFARSQTGFGPSIQTKNEGFFQRSRRKISATLPMFNNGFATANGVRKHDWRDSEKLGRGRWYPGGGGKWRTAKTMVGNLLRKFKVLWMLLVVIVATTLLLSKLRAKHHFRASSHFGGGSNFVIILAANEGGGVMDWKGPREWAIERDSIKNKKQYAEHWGYNLEIADVSSKKRYAHEWRESWEKVDIIRNAMVKYPKAEWFWWLDLNTFIMEPSISLQKHIFNNLKKNTYRDINHFNPLNITHPPTGEYLDAVARSPTGDNLTSSIDLIIPQDCSGFNLGSFFVRRSTWTDRLLDMWWDPVLYEQKHMFWEHKEQDALEHMYSAQPYLRTHVAFIEQRKVNSFPPAACSKEDENKKPIYDPKFHYTEKDRDFLVNMAGCGWGRDCWGEMYAYRELSVKLNRSTLRKMRDFVKDGFAGLRIKVWGKTDWELSKEKWEEEVRVEKARQEAEARAEAEVEGKKRKEMVEKLQKLETERLNKKKNKGDAVRI